MTTFGFAIDHRACIGCHACTVACKMENDVPLGVFRTWVKYIEKGEFPTSRRYFSVLRCNHCTDAPCISICPTNALYKRDNGIVDFDSGSCIGCKSCMQACPYDALYIEPETHTAAKCNFCAHRIEVGLEPACVIVCPTHAIVAGDLDDPASEIARMVATQETQVRAPEKGTGPNVFYLGADEAALDPTLTSQPDDYMWSETGLLDGQLQPRLNEADSRAKTTYDVEHPVLWGWKVSAYLWTKSVAGGALLIAIAALFAGHTDRWLLRGFAPVLAGAMTAVTGFLLVWDLKRPERFLYIILRSNLSSWLVRGAYVLAIHAAISGTWFLSYLFDADGVIDVMRWPGIPVAAMVAAYTAFLFGQAKGRDLWLSPMLAVVLVAQAAAAGAAVLAIAAVVRDADDALQRFLALSLLTAIAVIAASTAMEYSHATHGTRQARAAVRTLLRGPFASMFWWGAVVTGMIAPAALLAVSLAADGPAAFLAVASVLTLGGLFAAEHTFVKAGQSVPLS